ncbi:MAG: hypothetical protein HQ564_10715, partial [Candidatus Saganbacteria bacterium]|nr:hypothetical protein [Candidatus Saganbacteria bacterium]
DLKENVLLTGSSLEKSKYVHAWRSRLFLFESKEIEAFESSLDDGKGYLYVPDYKSVGFVLYGAGNECGLVEEDVGGEKRTLVTAGCRDEIYNEVKSGVGRICDVQPSLKPGYAEVVH